MKRSEDEVMAQADALMRRHRTFVARTDEELDPPDFSADIDIPVLTEVVTPTGFTPQTVEDIISVLHDEIDSAISDWLVEVLPVAVANASQQILAELDAKARHTLMPRLQEILAAHGKSTPAVEPDGEDEQGASV